MNKRLKLVFMAIAGLVGIVIGAVFLQLGMFLLDVGLHLAPEWATALLGSGVFLIVAYVCGAWGTTTLTKVFAKVLGKEVNE